MFENIIKKQLNADAQESATDISEAATATTTAPVEAVATAHDDFDWSVDKRNLTSYSKEEKEKYDKVYDDTFVQLDDGQMMKGLVVGLTKTDVVLNIGFKSDGLISLNEFRDLPNLAVGDEVEVMIVEKEDRDGHLNLSRRQARITRAWERIVEVHKTGEVITGTVTSKTKGGLIVDVFGMETFLPGSQIDVKPVTDYDQFVGKTMEFKVVKINETIKNAVVSHKALIESDIEAQRAEIMSKLEKGQVLEGTVKNITDFGAFMDLGGLDGLLYITDISWGRISHPSEVLKLDQKINVVVLDFDDEKKRISLGLKQLTPHPWDVLGENIVEGNVVKGKVVNIEDYGAFLEIQPGVEGLVHVSEITWANTPINAKEFFKLGDEHEAKIVTLDKDSRKMSLSIKQLSADPWNDIETNGIVTIYSEGKCINEWHLRPLKKGTARLAAKAWEENIPLAVLPVGLNYNSFRLFGKNVFINFGDIINQDYFNQNEPDGLRHQSFNNKLQMQLEKLVFEIPKIDKKQKQKLAIDQPLLKKLLLSIPALLGWLLHIPLYLPVKKLALSRTRGTDHFDSVLVAILLITYPLYIILSITLAWILTNCWWVIFFLLVAPFTAWSYVQIKPQLDK